MNLMSAIILGVIEGISEFLPISSTAHMILASHLMKLQQTEFLKSFEIAIQLGAILSVLVLYGQRLFVDSKILKRVAAAFLPTAVVGFFLYKIIKHVLFDNTTVILWSLLIGGIVLIVFELLHRESDRSTDDLTSITYFQAILIGIFQSLAVVPGVSRAAATIIGGMFLGLRRKTIVEFSFLLSVPTMGAAVALDLLKSAGSFTADHFLFLAVGFVVSFAVALLSIKFLLMFIQKNNFILFGVYRIVLALSLMWLL